jgi:tRNA pseudouridine55 synthase
MNGILLVDKPVGLSSFGVVAKVRAIIRNELGRKIKIGHTGTLDPSASGLMILVVGSYTKKASEFSKMDKTYEVEVSLGSVSTTGDSEGVISKKSEVIPTLKQINEALAKFNGEILQTPPAYSAIKIGGQRAYKLARAGKAVNIEPRHVQIYSIEQVEYTYPRLYFRCHVSSGTYIRSLAQDIGEQLRTGAYMSGLRRVSVGSYKIDSSVELEEIDFELLSQRLTP